MASRSEISDEDMRFASDHSTCDIQRDQRGRKPFGCVQKCQRRDWKIVCEPLGKKLDDKKIRSPWISVICMN